MNRRDHVSTAPHRADRSTDLPRTRRSGLSAMEVALLAALTVCLTYACIAAVTPAKPSAHVSTESIRVQPADTLWGIALEHPVDGLSTAETVQLIRSLNGFETSSLRVGDVVAVPRAQGLSTAVATR